MLPQTGQLKNAEGTVIDKFSHAEYNKSVLSEMICKQFQKVTIHNPRQPDLMLFFELCFGYSS